MERITLATPSIHCNACKANIEDALDDLDGVTAAAVDVEARTVRVEFEPDLVTDVAIAEAVTAAGYPATVVT